MTLKVLNGILNKIINFVAVGGAIRDGENAVRGKFLSAIMRYTTIFNSVQRDRQGLNSGSGAYPCVFTIFLSLALQGFFLKKRRNYYGLCS